MEWHQYGHNIIMICLVLNFVKPVSPLNVTAAALEIAVKNGKVVLKCTYTDKNPKDTTFVVLWQKFNHKHRMMSTVYNSQDSKKISKDTDRFKLVGLASLEIHPVLVTDKGKYRCQVTPLPSFEQDEAFTVLDVTYAPEFKQPKDSAVYASDGDLVTLSCQAYGNPNNITFTWFYKSHNGIEDTLQVRSDQRLQIGPRQMLYIQFLENHAGTYRCEANNSIGTSSITTKIILNQPARFVHVTNDPITATEGSDIIIEVQGFGVPNNLTYKWFHNNISIDALTWSTSYGFNNSNEMPYSRIAHSIENNRLEMKHISRILEGIYTCTVYNGIESPASTSITVNIQYPVELSFIPLESYTIVEGDAFSLFCNGTGNPSYSIEWETPVWGSLHVNSCIDHYSVSADGSLIIQPVHRNDSGIFTCILYNDIGKPAMAKSKIIAQYPPQIINELEPAYTIPSGLNFSLSCVSDGLPKPSITWYKDLIEIPHTNQDSYELIITDISCHDQGTYRCQAANSHGMTFVETKILVSFPPYIRELPIVRYVEIGRRVEITCLVSGYPLPLVQWEHGATDATANERSINKETRGRIYITESIYNSTTVLSTLIIQRLVLHDLGIYTCNAYSSMGDNTSVVEITQKPTVVPPVPQNVTVTDISDSEISIVWTFEKSVRSDARYHCEVSTLMFYREVVSCLTRSCVIKSLNASTIYRLSLFGVNSVGESQRSIGLTVKTSDIRSMEYDLTQTSLLSQSSLLQVNLSSILSTDSVSTPSSFTSPIRNDVIYGIMYDVTSGCIKWKVSLNMTNSTPAWDSSAIPRCVKVEAKRKNSTQWRVVSWCVAIWAEVCSTGLLQTSIGHEWAVRVAVCWTHNTGCRPYVTAKAKFFPSLVSPTFQTPQFKDPSTRQDWIPAFCASIIALSLVIILYAFTYAYMRRLRIMQAFRPLRQHRFRPQQNSLSRDVSSERPKRSLGSSFNRRVWKQERSQSLPGYYSHCKL